MNFYYFIEAFHSFLLCLGLVKKPQLQIQDGWLHKPTGVIEFSKAIYSFKKSMQLKEISR